MSLTTRATLALVLLASLAAAGCGGWVFGKRYEYEEDLYLSPDGSGEVIVNASIPALVALRGLDLDVDSAAMLDRSKLRAAYESPVTEVTRISRAWRRDGRRFVQVRLRTPDVRRLSEAAPFGWSRYELRESNGQRVFRQSIGPASLRPGTLRNVGWKGGELVAFRLHLPSRIMYHNARDLDANEPSRIQRGNIIAWEQLLTDRLDGQPLTIEVRMETQSILYRTLWLFAGAFAAAVLVLGAFIWVSMRKGQKEATT